MDKVKFGFEGSKFFVKVDLNANDRPLVSLSVDLAEIPGEIIELIFKKKEEPKA
jgi:hypothetical protein